MDRGDPSEERGWRDAETRHCGGNREAVKSRSHMNDFSSDETEKGPPLQTHSLREFEQHLNDLKKENFSLKLRIYFLEERIQQKFEDSTSEDVHRKNIELKVEVESLKQDLQERQQLLDKALTTAESLTSQNEAELQRHSEERQQEIRHMQEVLETKIQLLQEEAKLARSEAKNMAALAASESQRCKDLEMMMMEAKESEKVGKRGSSKIQQDIMTENERLIEELSESLHSREDEVMSLNGEISSLSHQVTQLKDQLQVMSKSLQEKERDAKNLQEDLTPEKTHKQLEMQKLIGEQQSQLVQYENAAGQCVSELQKAQLQVQSLQTKIRESEISNKKLQKRLVEMECELRSVREAAQGQERTIQTLSDSLNTKDMEMADLQQLIKEQKELLCSLKKQNQRQHLHQLQMSGVALGQLQTEQLELQVSLFSAQLELQGVQRSQCQAQRREDDLTRHNQRLLIDLQGAIHQRRESEKHNQELLAALQKARSDLEQMEERMKEEVREKERNVEERDCSIRELKTSLQHKEQLLHDYSELLDGQKEPGGNRDILIYKLKQRIQERDRALEHAVDERFVCMEQKEDEIRRLQLLLREKERDMEKLRCVLSSNEETITSLEALVRGKALEVEQVSEAWRSSQRIQHESKDAHTCSLRERDTLISQLQSTLHTRTKEAEGLTAALLSKTTMGSSEVLEELKSRLHLKERLFQELLADRNRQTQEHHTYIQDLLNTIHTRDQYIKDSAERMGQVMSEQAVRQQELRRQAISAENASQSTTEKSADTQCLQEELRLVLARERAAQNEVSTLHSTLAINQDRLQSQASELEALKQTLSIKDKLIKDLQMQMVEPSGLPLVQKLTQELQELRERGLLQDQSCPNQKGSMEDLASMETELTATSQADTGDFPSDEEEEDECNTSEFTDSTEEDEHCKLTAQSLAIMQAFEQHEGPVARPLSQDAVMEGLGLSEVKLLVEQKRAVERELWDLKAQLEKAGFSSFSQMRKALLSLRSENEELRILVSERKTKESGYKASEEEIKEVQNPAEDSLQAHLKTLKSEKRCFRPHSLDLQSLLSQPTQVKQQVEGVCGEAFLSHVEAGLKECTVRLRSDLELVQQESRELQERLMVSEATVHAQAEQLKDYRELLTETSVQQDSKQVQVDLQDLGYETCGRSENEAERDDTSSPEFDDLELCTSLSCRDGVSQWWSGAAPVGRVEGDVVFLQQLVEDLRGQLSRSQALVRSLQTRAQSTTPSSTPRKVNWGLESGAEEDEGWQSSDGCGSLPRRPRPDTELQELVARVSSLEEQLRKGKGCTEETKNSTWPGKFDALIQAQARELSHLRQRMREGRGVCHILTQHLGDTTKAFEELLRANDIDYYMGQSFREQLSQNSSLAQRVAAKISSRDHAELPEDKTGHELLAIRLSKELQQKDKLIESLRSKLDQQQPRSDTPASSHALSDATDQSERTSFISDEQGSTNEDLELCSELDAVSDFGQVEATERSNADSQCNKSPAPSHPSFPPSLTSSHGQHSSSSCHSMHCTSHQPVQTGLCAGPVSSSGTFPQTPHCPPSLSAQMASMPFDPQTPHLRPRFPSTMGFSLAEVHQELQMLQRQLGFSGAQVKPVSGYSLGTGLPQQAFQQSPLTGLNASPGLKSGAGLLESSALWDMAYGSQTVREGAYGDVSSGSSGYQSGARHTGADLMEEHLREIRNLRRRLEDSIQTNDRLRQQLEDKLASTARDGGGAPTNIYIQGLDSVGQLTNEVRTLKDDNHALQCQLQQARRDGMKEVEQLREVVLSGRGRLKQAELEAERWAEQCKLLQTQMQEQTQATLQLKQEKQSNQENANRLQHEVNVLQQQLSESRRLVHTLQCELQVYQRMCDSTKNVNTGTGRSLTLDLKEPQSPMRLLEQQLSDRLDPNILHSSVRKQLFHDPSPSPPVRDTGLLSPASPVSAELPVKPQSSLLNFQSSAGDSPKPGSGRRGESDVPDGSFACRTGSHVVGHIDNFGAVQQQLLEGKVIIRKIETTLRSGIEIALQEGYVSSLLTNTTALKQILEEAASALKMFWRAALPSTETTTRQLQKETSLREEVISLRRKLSDQEQNLRDTMETLRSSNRTKDSMEQFIVNQLSRTRDVLQKARTNLEKNELRISSLSRSFPPPSPQSLSSTPLWALRGEVPGSVYSSSGGGSVMTAAARRHHTVSVPQAAQCSGPQRPLDVFSNNTATTLSGFNTALSPLC